MKYVRIMMLGTALGLLCCFVPAAKAQSQDPFENLQLRVRLGAYFPTEGAVRDLNTIWAGIGADVIGKGLFGPQSESFLSADLYNRTGGGEAGTVAPIMFGQYWRENPTNDEYPRYYVGGGIGAVIGDIGGPSKTKFGAKILGGVDLSDRFSVELSYLLTDRYLIKGGTDDARANGLTLMVGYRL